MYKNQNLDNIGKIFGRWTIIEFSHKDEKQRALYWKCKCVCGNEGIIRYSQLKQGKSKSCGCYQKEVATLRIINANKKRVLPTGVAALRNLFRCYRKDSIARGIFFNLTIEEFIKIIGLNCYYCSIEPKQLSKNINWNGSYKYNGIDRVDNDKGYVINNVVPCCKWCNQAKSNRTESEFLFWIKNVYNHKLK